MKRTDIFTYPIWQWDNLEIDNSKIANHAYTLRSKQPEYRNPEGYFNTNHSIKWKSYNLTEKDFLAFPETNKLMTLITELVTPCFKELNPREDIKMCLTSSWFNIYPVGAHLESHPHQGNVLSGTYYVKAKPNSGDLIYITPDVSTYYNFPPKYFYNRNNITAVKHRVPPVEHSLVVAPSNIMHSVKENNSGEDRISFTFNFNCIDVDPNTPNDRYF